MPNKKIHSPKTDYEPKNNHLQCPTKKYVVRKQTTKQIITCCAKQKNSQSENRLQKKITCRAQTKKYVVLKQTA